MEQYLPIVLLLFAAFAFAAGSFAASKLLGPLRPTGAKEGPYESGIVPAGPTTVRFPVQFYMVAMLFIIFDIEVVFLYPWAVIYHQLDRFGLAEMATFAVVVFVSFAYLVSNGALDWGPARKEARAASADLTRTTTSTVRRVRRPEDLSSVATARATAPGDGDPSLGADTDTGGDGAADEGQAAERPGAPVA